MRPRKKKSVSSNKDADVKPLKLFNGTSRFRNCSIEELRRYSIQVCEFCDAKCVNRFDMLIHNSTHIIIPLLKEETQYCNKCGLLCISNDHIANHLLLRHNKSFNTYSSRSTNIEEYENDEHFTDDETLDHLIKNEQENGGILKNLIKNCKVDIEKFDTPWLNDGFDEYDIPDTGRRRSKRDSLVDTVKPSIEPLSDISLEDDPIILMCQNRVKEAMCFDSVHYDDLIKPGIYHCKHCYRLFPTRYEVIKHEMIHLDISKIFETKRKRGRPKKGSIIYNQLLKTLKKRKHKAKNMKQKLIENGEPKRRMRKLKTILAESKLDDKCNTTENSVKWDSHTGEIHLCDGCLCSTQRKSSVKCDIIKTDDIDKKCCQICRRSFYNLTIVKVTQKASKPQRIADRIQFEDAERPRRPHSKSNSDRLKLIQNRFKLINKSVGYVNSFAKEKSMKKVPGYKQK